MPSTPDDTSGYAAVIAEIPKGQLSERQTRIAAGVALVRDGMSINRASKECGIPYTTLYGHAKGITDPDYEKAFTRGEQRLVESHLAIASLAADKVFERVADDSMKDSDLIKAMGVSTDKVALRRQWGRGPANADDRTQNALASFLERVRVSAHVTVEPARPGDDAIEVEAGQY